MGALYVDEWQRKGLKSNDIGQARGDVKIPAGWDPTLEIYEDGYRDLRPLLKLGPDDLHKIGFAVSLKITDADLAYLSPLKGLRQLNLYSQSNITDAGLAHLAGLTNLEELCLFRTSVTDAGLKHLAGLKALRKLILSGTGVRGPGLVHLQGLNSLQKLELRDLPLTDAGVVPFLKGPASLQILELFHTRVTPAGRERLRKQLPECAVLPWP